MSWIKDGDGSTAEGNGIGVTSITETYWLFGPVDPEAVAASPTDFIGGMAGQTGPLPAYGSPHPNYTALRLRNWSVRRINNNAVAVATYSIGSAIFERDWYSWNGGFQTEELAFPYARRYRYTIPGYSTDNISYLPVDRDAWAVETVNVRFTVRRNEIPVNIGGEIGPAVKAMEEQNNAIHIINGTAYRFEAGAYYETRPGVWIVNYAWIYESGIRWNSTLESDADVVFPPRVGGLLTAPNAAPNSFLIPPFYEVDAIPNPDTPEDPPTFRLRLPYAYVPNGHLSLIGLPPL